MEIISILEPELQVSISSSLVFHLPRPDSRQLPSKPVMPFSSKPQFPSARYGAHTPGLACPTRGFTVQWKYWAVAGFQAWFLYCVNKEWTEEAGNGADGNSPFSLPGWPSFSLCCSRVPAVLAWLCWFPLLLLTSLLYSSASDSCSDPVIFWHTCKVLFSFMYFVSPSLPRNLFYRFTERSRVSSKATTRDR